MTNPLLALQQATNELHEARALLAPLLPDTRGPIRQLVRHIDAALAKHAAIYAALEAQECAKESER